MLVIVPTYHERDNIEHIVGRLRAAVPSRDVLVVDDASPDGTGDLADALAAADPQVHVLHRPRKEGLGAAYLAGFGWGLERDYEVLVEMDADGSHQPEQLPRLLAALRRRRPGAGLPLGAGRLGRQLAAAAEAAVPGRQHLRAAWPWGSASATPPAATGRSGASTLETLDLAASPATATASRSTSPGGPCSTGCGVVEVPIEFVERERGDSKMSGAIVREALWRVTVWAARERATRLRAGVAGREGLTRGLAPGRRCS